MNALDRLISVFSPESGLRRAHARAVLASYEGAEKSRLRKFHREVGGINELIKKAAPNLRAQARYLERNHDLSRGAIRTLVNNVVGPNGIGIEPQPRRRDGSINQEYASALLSAYRDWCRAPEVTKRLTWSRAQRMLAQRWCVDGEVFAQAVIGPVASLDHGTNVPFSLELLEADMVPHGYDANNANGANTVRQGVERNAWGEPKAYWVSKVQPDEYRFALDASQLKRIPAERMYHLYSADRLHQLRGVSMFATVITRLEDIKDYEESERVAAKIAAMLTAYVKKGTPDLYNPGDGPEARNLALQPGMIIDNLGMGEEIGMIDSKRPNMNLVPFRQGQLRAAAAGFGVSYSSFSRDYNGTYSARRQELVEQWVNYAVLTDEFVGQIVAPVWRDFVRAAHLSGVVPMPKDLAPGSEDDALFVAQAMPWIDPLKEATACEALVRAGFASEVEMIRRRGANPTDVLDQIAAWREACKERGVAFTTTAAPSVLQDLFKEQDQNSQPEK